LADTAGVQVFQLDQAPAFMPAPGIAMRGAFGAGTMLNLVTLEADAILPLHSHPHEQIGFVLSGIEILEIAGTEYRLGPNSVYSIPGGVEHSGRGGPEGCVLIDVFTPVRDDYRAAMEALAAPNDERHLSDPDPDPDSDTTGGTHD
jgi:quercetin dioxygenase-like cupin family protein